MTFKLLGATAMLALLAACSSTPEKADAAAGAGQATAPAPSGPRAGSQEDLVVNVGDRVFFDFDSAAIRADARATLQRQSDWLKQNASVAVTLEGHTDERGTREYNLALGQRRAAAARDFVVSQGVAPARIQTISYGKERPVALGSNEEAWAQNRRGVTVVR